jgi:hypothetical protein
VCPQVSEILQGPKGKETSVGTSGLTGGGPGTRETARMAPDQVREFSSTAGGTKPIAEMKEKELAPEEAAWGREEHGQGRAGTRVMARAAVWLRLGGCHILDLRAAGAGRWEEAPRTRELLELRREEEAPAWGMERPEGKTAHRRCGRTVRRGA